MRSWLLLFPLAAMASTEVHLKPRQAVEFCSSWRPCTEGGQATQLTTYCRSILSMSDQTGTITAYDSRTTERRTITTSLAATTTIYFTTVTTTSTVTGPTSGVYVYTSTATTVTTSTVTVYPTVTTTMTTQAPDATQVVSRCLAPGVVQQKRELVEDHGLIKRQSSSSSVPIPNCFLKPYSTALGDGRSTVTTSTTGKGEQSAVCKSCASVTPFTSTTTTRVTTPTTITSTSTMSVITRRMTVTSGTSTTRVDTAVCGTTVTYSVATTSTVTRTLTIIGTDIKTTITKTLNPTSTTYTLTGAAASPTFYIANIDITRQQVDNGVPVLDYGWHYVVQDYNKQVAGGNVLKFKRGLSTPPSGAERFVFYVNPSGTSLTGTLYNVLNGVAGENPIEYPYPNGTKYRYYEVALFNRQALFTLSIPPVACRYSGGRFSTCPMRCWWTGDGSETNSSSVSQGAIDGPWYLAKPGQVSQSTYPLYAVN